MTADGPASLLPCGRRLVHSPAALIATWFGTGLLRPAPGTWGSLAALPAGLAAMHAGGPWAVAAAALLVFAVGILATSRLIRLFPADAEPDNGSIVVDEVAGQLIALVPALLSPVLWVAAFALFRLFDIWKPGPVAMIERRAAGAWGVMLDDLAAGLMAAGCVWALSLAGLADA